MLDHYLDGFQSGVLRPNAPIGLATLKDWFACRSDPDRLPEIANFGCLMMNAVIELHEEDPEINARAQRYFQMVRRFLLGHLQGNVTRAEAKADVLATSALGVNAVIRASGDMRAGQAFAASIIATLDEWSLAQ